MRAFELQKVIVFCGVHLCFELEHFLLEILFASWNLMLHFRAAAARCAEETSMLALHVRTKVCAANELLNKRLDKRRVRCHLGFVSVPSRMFGDNC